MQHDDTPHSVVSSSKKDCPEALDSIIEGQALSNLVEGLCQLIPYDPARACELQDEQQGTEYAELAWAHQVDKDAHKCNEGKAHVPACQATAAVNAEQHG